MSSRATELKQRGINNGLLPSDQSSRFSGPSVPQTPSVNTDAILRAVARPSRRIRVLERGAMVGRYEVATVIGVGGMSIVYSARDLELKRTVALKLLQRQSDGGLSIQAQARLKREAQALARLSHPNIVSVYDVGVHDGEMWIAMEYVDGVTLREWKARNSSSWKEILKVLLEVAQGLAAAHACALVHRDLKPENVMIGEDGRVRVMDFGLVDEHKASNDDQHVVTQEMKNASANKTRNELETVQPTTTGVLLGSPAYMAPEQWQGIATGPAADQYAWSVMAWELLYDERPYTGADLDELRRRVLAGTPRKPTRGRRVPAWLVGIITRGLARNSDERWPNIDSLLVEIAGNRRRARRRVFGGLAGAVVVVAGSLWAREVVHDRRQQTLCDSEANAIDDVWTASFAVELRNAFVASGSPHAVPTSDKVVSALDDYAQEWASTRKNMCLKLGPNSGDGAGGIRAKSDWCFEDRRLRLGALVTEFSRASPAVVDNAVSAVSLLEPVEACSRRELLVRLPHPPPHDRDDVVRFRQTHARVKTLDRTGQYEAALIEARSLITVAETLEWPPLEAAAHHAYGVVLSLTDHFEDAESELEEAYFMAASAGDDRLSALASIKLTHLIGDILYRYEDSIHWARLAELALTEFGEETGPTRASFLLSRGDIERRAGNLASAREFHEAAVEMHAEVFGPASPALAASSMNLGLTLRSLGEYDEAFRYQSRALDLYEETLGSVHPRVALAQMNLAIMYAVKGDYKTARRYFQKSYDTYRELLGPDHLDTTYPLYNLANLDIIAGDYEAARSKYEQALLAREQHLDPDHPLIAECLTGVASVHGKLGDHERARDFDTRALEIMERRFGETNAKLVDYIDNLALDHYGLADYEVAELLHRRALGIAEEQLGSRHPQVAQKLGHLGDTLIRLGQNDEAREVFERALSIMRGKLSPGHAHLSSPLHGLARIALAERRTVDAIEYAEEALRISKSADVADVTVAESQFLLARALIDQDRERALGLARLARVSLAEADADALDEVDQWLGRHGGPKTVG